MVGNPVRPEVFTQAKNREAIRAELGAGDRTVILSFGGSLGARRVNEVVADLCAWEQRNHKPVLHLHATGQYGVQLFQDLEKEKGFAPGESLVVKEYINNMPELLAAADLVISRAGALTLAELEAVGRAAVLIPSPNVAENHQYYNAMELQKAGAAVVIEEKDLTGEAMIIAYRKERFQSVSLETFWLSPTPYVPGSRYPVQSMCPRTATDVVFEDMETGKVFRVINTHLDHECAGARKLGLEQILAHLRAEKAFADVPVILSGDFNAEPDSEEMKPLRETAGLVNATEGIGITFHNFHRDDPNDPQCSIDYIILKGDWELKKVEKWTEQKDGVCLSDHDPICAELI